MIVSKLIIVEFKKKATAPINKALAKEKVAKVVAVNANVEVIIAPTELTIKHSFFISSHLNLFPHNAVNIIYNNAMIPKIRVTYNSAGTEMISPP